MSNVYLRRNFWIPLSSRGPHSTADNRLITKNDARNKIQMALTYDDNCSQVSLVKFSLVKRLERICFAKICSRALWTFNFAAQSNSLIRELTYAV